VSCSRRQPPASTAARPWQVIAAYVRRRTEIGEREGENAS
jgi:hypothetical protein